MLSKLLFDYVQFSHDILGLGHYTGHFITENKKSNLHNFIASRGKQTASNLAFQNKTVQFILVSFCGILNFLN